MQCFQSKQYKVWSNLLEGQWQKFLLHSAALLLLRTLRLLGTLEQRPPISTSVLSVHVKKLLISTQTSAVFPDTVLTSCYHFLWVNEYWLNPVFSTGQFTQLLPCLLAAGYFIFPSLPSPCAMQTWSPIDHYSTGWVLPRLVLWLLCPLVPILNTCTLYKDEGKSDVYLIITHGHNFSRHRLLMFSPRFGVQLNMDLKTNVMNFYIQKYMVCVQLFINTCGSGTHWYNNLLFLITELYKNIQILSFSTRTLQSHN